MAGRGGRRTGAGRKATKPAGLAVQKSVALEVLSRLEELGIPRVKTEADYVLHLMKNGKNPEALFTDMLNRAHGKPAQAVIAEGKLVLEVRELSSGNHPAAEAGASSQIM